MWATGDYPRMVKTFLLPLGPRLVEACGSAPTRIASSTSHPEPGTLPMPNTRLGADVVASDLTPRAA